MYCIGFQHPALLDVPPQTGPVRIIDSFSQLSLREDVIGALKSVGVTRPTTVQVLAIPKIARGKNVICAAETGV